MFSITHFLYNLYSSTNTQGRICWKFNIDLQLEISTFQQKNAFKWPSTSTYFLNGRFERIFIKVTFWIGDKLSVACFRSAINHWIKTDPVISYFIPPGGELCACDDAQVTIHTPTRLESFQSFRFSHIYNFSSFSSMVGLIGEIQAE